MQASGGAQVSPDGPRSRVRVVAAAIALVLVGLDQLTKTLVVRSLGEGESINVIGDFLRITHVRNTGAAFGILKGFGGVFALAALVGVVVFAAIVVRQPTPVSAIAAALIAAGASGNLLDRLVRTGGVVDFVDFRFWPSFNVADSAITVGALLMLFTGFGEQRKASSGD
jgi:signal peptidase II